MAVLRFPGSDRVLTAHAAALPQPDQLCGPFSARVALHAVLEAGEVPSLGTLAAAAGTAIWPHDVEQWRPAGAPLDRTGWDGLALAPTFETSGSTAAQLVEGLESAVGDRVAVLALPCAGLAPSSLRALLTSLLRSPYPHGIVANLSTGPVAPEGMIWDVGHFVVLCALDLGRDEVLVGDTYAELGALGQPRGCRAVPLRALADALGAEPGRGLIVLADRAFRTGVETLVSESGLTTGVWAT